MIQVILRAGRVPLGSSVSQHNGLGVGVGTLTDLNRPGTLVIVYREHIATLKPEREIVWHAEEQELLDWLSGLKTEAAREAASQEVA